MLESNRSVPSKLRKRKRGLPILKKRSFSTRTLNDALCDAGIRQSPAEYLKSDRWKTVSDRVLANTVCANCPRPAKLVFVAEWSAFNVTGHDLFGLYPACPTCHSLLTFDPKNRDSLIGWSSSRVAHAQAKLEALREKKRRSELPPEPETRRRKTGKYRVNPEYARRTRDRDYLGRHKVCVNLGFKDYATYLQSRKWAKIRGRVYAKYGKACQLCGNPATEIHHTAYDYRTMTGSDLSNLHPICRTCHDEVEINFDGSKATPREAANRFFSLFSAVKQKFCP